ncbi:SpoIIE family protein phosphatase [uncultured Sphaerochaeta sp.]|uniref:ATP-binding SpoIIE family protein phosphatase n=1 Tax=uncultured Sphaerochaeta sp. TaxID=886478 RepID=UPI0029CA57C2|nr:SpoIIE family protein phosphatase [uncultured Sphaerochaeta sp.]
MKDMNIEQICYKILLSIGDSLDLRKMLGMSLATYMKELGCTMGAVLLAKQDEQDFGLQIAYAVPRSLNRQESFKTLMDELSHASQLQDNLVTKVGDGRYYVMSLADMGLLVLYRQAEELPEALLDALRPLNHKLGTACKACLQNTALENSSQRFMEMANMLPGLIVELDKEHHITFYNRRTHELFRQIDSDEFHPDHVEDFFPQDEIEHIHNVLHTLEIKKTPLISEDFWMVNSRGTRFKVNFVLSPIHDGETIIGFRGIATDITERVRLEEEQKALLARVSDRVRELDCLFSILKLVADERNTLADIFNKAIGTIQTTFLSHASLTVGIEYGSNTYGNCRGDCKGLVQEAPIMVDSEKRGKLIIQIGKESTFTKEEILLIASLGTQFSSIAAKKETEEKIQSLYNDIMEDLDTAQSIQNYILPRWFKAEGNVIFSANYRPWAQIGGDLFDCLKISETRYVAYVADISGHGVQAALIMMGVKSVLGMILSTARPDCTPAEIVTRLNKTLSDGLFKDSYMTLCLCVVDVGSMSIQALNAGHPPMAIINRKQNTIRILDQLGDIPLGWDSDHEYSPSLVMEEPLSSDDMLVLYTDGVFESTNDAGETLELGRFLDLLHTDSNETEVAMMPQECHAMVDRNGFIHRQDDFTCIAMQVREPSEYSTVLELPASLTMVDKTAQECADFILKLGRSEMDAWRCRIVASEFMNNIIVHGLETSLDEIIALEVSVGEEIILTIRDRAAVWDLPPHPESSDQFFDLLNEDEEASGRGMQIIYSLTKDQKRRRIHNVNETTFILAPSESD